MERSLCKDCRYFVRHYLLTEDRAAAVNCGHCTAVRRRHRNANAAACEKFEKGEHPLPQREPVVNFLTTSFLEYVLSLPLPPEIDEG